MNIDMKKVKDMYNNMHEIWPKSDKWYNYTHQRIISYIQAINKKHCLSSKNLRIINIGSAGNEYNISGDHYHVDIAEEKISHCAKYFSNNAEELTFPNNYFDFGLCVGSVINYCDPLRVISEISRVLKPGASLVLDFEQSQSFQFLGSKVYNSNVSLIKSFNDGNEDYIWVFSKYHIFSLCKTFGLKVQNIEYFHILSPFLYKFLKNEKIAGRFSIFDVVLNKIPYINNISCNIILTLIKK